MHHSFRFAHQAIEVVTQPKNTASLTQGKEEITLLMTESRLMFEKCLLFSPQRLIVEIPFNFLDPVNP